MPAYYVLDAHEIALQALAPVLNPKDKTSKDKIARWTQGGIDKRKKLPDRSGGTVRPQPLLTIHQIQFGDWTKVVLFRNEVVPRPRSDEVAGE